MMLHDKFVYIGAVILISIGMYIMTNSSNNVRKLIGLSIFQAAIVLFYISVGYVSDSVAPIVLNNVGDAVYSSAVPHVLMLTAIVVGIATLSVGLALSVRINNCDQ